MADPVRVRGWSGEDSGQLRHGARPAHSGGGGGGEDDPARRVEAGGGAVQLVPEAQG